MKYLKDLREELRDIVELFDNPYPSFLWQSGTLELVYTFGIARLRGGKWIPHPHGRQEIEDFYKRHGLEITGRDGNVPLVNGKPTNLTGSRYEVGFHTLSTFKSQYKPLIDNSNLKESDLGNIWELYFTQQDTKLSWFGGSRPPSWSFEGTSSKSDNDLAEISGASAALILGTVLDITRKFIALKNPKGILIGTKQEAKDARGRIYRGMARRYAAEVFDLPYAPRADMKHASLIWFDKSMKFEPNTSTKGVA